MAGENSTVQTRRAFASALLASLLKWSERREMGKFRYLALGLAAGAASLAIGAAQADVIPYGQVGTPITTASYNFIAISTGSIEAYFYSSDASDTEEVSMMVNGVQTGIFGLNNQTSAIGQDFNLGPVKAGDAIDFFIRDISSGDIWADTNNNPDGDNHAYVAAYTGGHDGIPAGTYVGFEDRGAGGDYDYNDVQFVFANVANAVPEPSTWAMMLLGFAGLGFGAFRRARKSDVSIVSA